MIGVDLIGQIRRAYFEQHRAIKEIVRTLSVSRATVRKVIRSHRTEFKYERTVQPTPKLGIWVDILTEFLEREAKLPKRERRSTQRLFEELRGRGYDDLRWIANLRHRDDSDPRFKTSVICAINPQSPSIPA
jgi:transposase